MTITTIGDIHGRNDWKKKLDDSDLIVFLGDYVDSFNKSDEEIKDNLIDIIQYKKENIEKVELLLGNHDIQYLFHDSTKYGCSGYRSNMTESLFHIFNENRTLFNLAFQIDKTLWTHAGVHQGWYDFRFNKHSENEDEKLADTLNKAFWREYGPIFDVGHIRGGSQNVGGPLWLDIRYGWNKPLKGYHQIVGHSVTKKINKNTINKETSIVYIDTGENYSKYTKTL